MPRSRRRSRRKREPIRIGTDCSGIEAPVQALKNLGIPFKHVFSSDTDKYCVQSILANYEPEVLFGGPGPFPDGDIRRRKISDVPDLDLYVCGFPCQPFSQVGMKKGLNDPRGNVFEACLKVIKKKLPRYFVLENVRGLMSNDKGRTWGIIWDKLCKLKRYSVSWELLNTKDYGIPQSRTRIFIVGIRNHRPFNFPEPFEASIPLQDFVDTSCTERNAPLPYRKNLAREAKLSNIPFIDLCMCPNGRLTESWKTVAPCIVAMNRNYYCCTQGRRATVGELLALQGFDESFLQIVSDTQMKKQIGNSMSVNVLEEIFRKLLV